MITPRVEVVNEKTIRVVGLNQLLASCLQGLDEILALRDSPAAGRRLIPPPSTDEAINAEWEKFVTPDLRHLFVTAGETVLRDLTALEIEPRRPNHLRVAFPSAHLDAWLSALNQARLILGEQFHVTDPMMERRDLDPQCETDLAILRIHLLGWVLELLVEFSTGNTGPAA